MIATFVISWVGKHKLFCKSTFDVTLDICQDELKSVSDSWKKSRGKKKRSDTERLHSLLKLTHIWVKHKAGILIVCQGELTEVSVLPMLEGLTKTKKKIVFGVGENCKSFTNQIIPISNSLYLPLRKQNLVGLLQEEPIAGDCGTLLLEICTDFLTAHRCALAPHHRNKLVNSVRMERETEQSFHVGVIQADSEQL